MVGRKAAARKVIDVGGAAPETLLAGVNAYLTRPNGYDLSGMAGEANLRERKIVANSLLMFQSTMAPPPANIPNEIQVDLRALSIGEAREDPGLGTVHCATGRFTATNVFNVLLRN